MRALTVAVALLVAGCGDGGGPEMPTIAPPTTYAFDVFASNYDSISYSVWVEWQEAGSGAWKGSQLYVLPAAPSGSHSSRFGVYHVTPGTIYYLVLANGTGTTLLHSVELGSLTTPAYLPRIVGYDVHGSKLTKTY